MHATISHYFAQTVNMYLEMQKGPLQINVSKKALLFSKHFLAATRKLGVED